MTTTYYLLHQMFAGFNENIFTLGALLKPRNALLKEESRDGVAKIGGLETKKGRDG